MFSDYVQIAAPQVDVLSKTQANAFYLWVGAPLCGDLGLAHSLERLTRETKEPKRATEVDQREYPLATL